MVGQVGRADYYAEGDWNIACSLCGRKRKASMMVKNWQGFWRCPWHNEPRQTQDFVRGTKDIQTAPFTLPQTDKFVQYSAVFPSWIAPSPLVLVDIGVALVTLAGYQITTLSGDNLFSQTNYVGLASVGMPTYIIPVSYLWSWKSGGVGIIIDTPLGESTFFSSSTAGNSGVAQCLITNTLGQTSVATLSVSS